MDFKPGEFFVGIIDFFAILMPGALLTYTAKDFAQRHVFGVVLPSLQTEAQGWVAFIFSSYLLGHFIFLMGSFLDRSLYDRFRKRWLIENDDRLFKRAQNIKEQALGDSPLEEVVNTFKWAKAQVQLFHATAATEIHRLEADSKFFRSLIIVLFIITIILLTKLAWLAALVSVFLMGLSFVRYADQRYKSTALAYTCLLVMQHKQNLEIALKVAEKNK